MEEPQKRLALNDHVKELLKKLEIAGVVDDKRVSHDITIVFKRISRTSTSLAKESSSATTEYWIALR